MKQAWKIILKVTSQEGAGFGCSVLDVTSLEGVGFEKYHHLTFHLEVTSHDMASQK